MAITLKKEIKLIVSQSVRETLTAEMSHFRAMLFPLISKAEQRDIETRYGKKPSRTIARVIKTRL